MTRIYKYPIELKDRQNVKLPSGAEILTAQMQNGILHLFAVVEVDSESVEPRSIEIFGTGSDMRPSNRKYITTFRAGSEDWPKDYHVFEKKEQTQNP